MYQALQKAQLQSQKQHTAYDDYVLDFSLEQISEWTKHVKKWNKDFSYKPNPYEEPVSSMLLGVLCIQ